MKSFIKTIKNIWNIEELKNRILFALLFLCIYRFGTYVPLPGINPKGISDITSNFKGGTKGFIQILSSFTGGAFSTASILALGIMPYISASIIVQLMGLVFPFLQKMQKEGESGRRRMSRITRWLTLGICFLQAPAYLTLITSQFASTPSAYLININSPEWKFLFWVVSIVVLTTGTMFTMWLGEKITDRGIGNGVSLIIMVGIIARFPKAIGEELYTRMGIGKGGLVFLFFELILWFLVILFSIFIIQAVRRVPIQYIRRMQGGISERYISNSLKESSHQFIPLKLISAGVMPIIFAQAVMFLPLTFIGSIENEKINRFLGLNALQDIYGFWYNLIFAILIIVFTFFYTAIAIPIKQMADDLKRNGGHIPGVRPGKDTYKVIDDILSKITFPGAFLLAFIAVLPSLVVKIGISKEFALFYGGTSLLIIVGVVLDTIQHIDVYLLNNHYSGFVESSNYFKKNKNLI